MIDVTNYCKSCELLAKQRDDLIEAISADSINILNNLHNLESLTLPQAVYKLKTIKIILEQQHTITLKMRGKK